MDVVIKNVEAITVLSEGGIDEVMIKTGKEYESIGGALSSVFKFSCSKGKSASLLSRMVPNGTPYDLIKISRDTFSRDTIAVKREESTLIVYNAIGDDVSTFIVPGNLSHLNGVCVNAGDSPRELINEAIALLYNERGENNHELCSDTSQILSKEWDHVAIISFVI